MQCCYTVAVSPRISTETPAPLSAHAMADDSSQSDQLINEDRESDSDHADSENDGADKPDEEETPPKRPRVVDLPRCGPTPPLPRDVSDAMILLRVEKEKKFLSAADGRSRNGSTRIWEDISAEMRATFGDREDLPAVSLTPRSLSKRWSYVEKMFKVSALHCTDGIHELLRFALVLAGLPCSAEAKWRCSPATTCLRTDKGGVRYTV